jgi:hypothetical protein
VALDEIQLEHRLTQIEGKIESGFIQIVSATNELSNHVKIQNGRIAKLEQLRIQLIAIVGVIMAIAPFAFVFLDRLIAR